MKTLTAATVALIVGISAGHYWGKQTANKWWEGQPPRFAPIPEHVVKGMEISGNCERVLYPGVYYSNVYFNLFAKNSCRIKPWQKAKVNRD